MYRIEVQSPASAPFASLTEAQEAHIALVTQADGLNVTDKVTPENAREAMVAITELRRNIREFEWKLAATGAVIADPQQRVLAQSLLDFWALRHIELRERAWQFGQQIGDRRRPMPRRPVSPRTLLPADEGLAEALADTAERIYRELPDDAARDRARDLFLAIASPYSGAWEIDSEVASRFVAKNVIVGSGGSGAARYALAHDSIATQWQRLVEWMEQARRDETEFKLVADNALNWQATQSDDDLPQGAALEQARRFVSRDAAIAKFVATADAAWQRQKSYNHRMLTLIIVVGCLIAVIAGIGGRFSVPKSLGADPEEAKRAANLQSALVSADNQAAAADQKYEAKSNQLPKPSSVAAPTLCGVPSDFKGYIWIGSAGNSQVQTSGGKPIEPDKVQANMTLSLAVWLNLREVMPNDDGKNRAGLAIGTASARSLAITLEQPKSVMVGVTRQYWAKVKLPSSVYIQVPDGGSEKLANLVERLKSEGLVVPAVQKLPMSGMLNEVRYYYEQDRARAEQVACLANQSLAPDGRDRVTVRSLANTSLAAKVNNGTIELWLYPQGERR